MVLVVDDTKDTPAAVRNDSPGGLAPMLAPADELEPSGLTNDEVEEVGLAEPSAAPISYSGTDFDAEGLVRRYERGDIVVPNFGHDDDDLELAQFQRGFVWRRGQMDRFIESLLLGYPIPGIMLVEQADKRYLVLDGQQRLKTLAAFRKGLHAGVQFSLVNVADEFKGLTYENLTNTQRRTLDNTFITATIVRSDGSPNSLESVYQVFERLNSGGTQLTPHEIRIALYPGLFVRLLAELNTASGWREIYGPTSLRLRDQELILRILALFSRSAEYSRPMKGFLNRFLSDHRQLTSYPTERNSELFRVATQALSDGGARQILRRQGQRINIALLESVIVACMHRAEGAKDLSPETIGRGLLAIGSDAALARATSSATTNEDSVESRLQIAARAFDQ